jgi:hypothetical protein
MDFDKESQLDSQESQADNEENKDTLGALGSVSDSFINGIVWHLFSGSILFFILSFVSFFILEETESIDEFILGLLSYIKIASFAIGLTFLLSFFIGLFVLSKDKGMTIKEYIDSLKKKYK